MVASGAREIVLLGQNVNAFHGTGGTGNAITLAGLIRELAALPGLARLRYMTSHPRDMDDALIAAHAEVPELMPYLHLPVQSGSTRILKAMNRAHTVTSYLATLDRLRKEGCREGAEGVGQATTEAVVYSSIAILISNFFLTLLLGRLFHII